MNLSKSARTSLALLALLLAVSGARGQEWVAIKAEPAAAPAVLPALPSPTTATAPERTGQPDFLSRLPHPPDQPASLYEAASPPNTATARPGPYFEIDPLLDPPDYPRPGFFGMVEAQVLSPHIYKSIVNTVVAGARPPDVIQLPNRGLDWTVAPHFELGFNLPSGFGGFALGYRTLSSAGSAFTPGPDAVSPSRSRLDLNSFDVDYISREFTPSDRWTMRWRVGGRWANVYFDPLLTQPPAAAAAGSGILQEHATNKFTGFGPHATLELSHRLNVPGLSILARGDVASMLGRINQRVSESALDATNPIGVSFGQTAVGSSQTTPAISLLFGVDWQPPQWSFIHCSAGYQYEYWFNVGRFSLIPQSRGELQMQGFVGRIEFNY